MEFVKKSIEEVSAMTAEAQTEYLKAKESFESEMKLKELAKVSNLEAKSSENEAKLKAANEEIVKLGTEVAKMKEVKSAPKSKKGLLAAVLESKKTELEELVKKGSGSLSIVLDEKATQTYGDIDSGEDFAQFRQGIIDQPVRGVVFKSLFRNTPLSTQFLKYTEQDSVVRDAKNVANCAPVTSLTKETLKVSNIEPVKVKDIITGCTDFINDFPFMEARMRRLLTESVMLKVDQQILLGSGTAPETNSIDSVSSEFDAANVACPLTASIQTANYIDLIRGMATQVWELGKQNSFMPDTVIVNNCDWFKLVESDKDANNNYLDNRVVMQGGSTYVVTMAGLLKVVTSPIVASNTCYVLDSTKGEIIDRQQFTIDIAFENASEWESDLFSMKGAERVNFLVPNEVANAFMKCSDVATAIGAITSV